MLDPDIKEYLHNLTSEIIEVKGKVGEVNCALEVLTVEVVHACKQVADLCEDMDGDGHPGVKAQLQEHLVRHDERGRLFKLLATVGGGSGIAGLLTAIFK